MNIVLHAPYSQWLKGLEDDDEVDNPETPLRCRLIDVELKYNVQLLSCTAEVCVCRTGI